MKAAGFELIAIQTKPQKPAPHAVLLVICDAPAATRLRLCQSLLTESQTELDVRFDLARVSGRIEKPELNRPLRKGSMEVKPSITARIVMIGSVRRITVPVPSIRQFRECLRLMAVDYPKQILIDLLAISETVWRDLQRAVQNILLLCHQIYQIRQRLRRVP